MKAKDYSPLLKWVGRLLRYYLLALFGFAIACILTASFGATQLANFLLVVGGEWVLRLALFNGCLVGVAAMVESLRQ
ncbi:hypothetical protein IQ268_20485 [Oculatella sp. LEGE 06141]|uniref:hypothetical protein n=1 Tax=Oculatella sp. LEGE 06141 TaxID=1828648 RepID=UPI0018825DFC|nr:hypothetical protein [Oculatella sp. LEGE 06141]MBE9180941.1 hypothetical protein [Oculatella sp. LEGE 06141]